MVNLPAWLQWLGSSVVCTIVGVVSVLATVYSIILTVYSRNLRRDNRQLRVQGGEQVIQGGQQQQLSQQQGSRSVITNNYNYGPVTIYAGQTETEGDKQNG